MARSRRKRRQRRRAGGHSARNDVQLSRHDLSQLDEAYLLNLGEERLRTLSVKLLADLKAAHDRLEQNSRNSSRPPSSEAPWEGGETDETSKRAAAQNEEDKAPDLREKEDGQEGSTPDTDGEQETTESRVPQEPRRSGQRPGAPGHGRTQSLPIDHERHHHPATCAVCGGTLTVTNAERTHSACLVIDLRELSADRAGLEVMQSKQIYHERRCECGHWTRAEPGHCAQDSQWGVALSERHLIGPLLVALICALSLRMRLSRRRVQEFLHDWLGLQLGVATINQCLHEAARALEPVVEEQLLAEVRSSDLLHADETSWKEHGRLLWLWVFTTATTTVFTIGRRSQELLHGMLGTVIDGWLMSDGYWAYRDYDNRLRCLTHLLRKARGLEDSLDRRAQRFGTALRTGIEAVMAAVYAAREGPPPIPLREQHAKQLNALLDLCIEHAEAKHEKTRALARELLNDWNTFWIVLDHPELPLTNNLAERALRHWVIARRISYGTRNPQGSRAFTLLASVIETCRLRGQLPWPYIAEVLRQRRQGNAAPALPVTVL
jgi:transposase